MFQDSNISDIVINHAAKHVRALKLRYNNKKNRDDWQK